MQTSRLFDVRCSSCDKGIALPETILEDIFQYLQTTSTDAEQLTLVCPDCKAPFLFDYRRRSERAVGMTALPLERAVDHAWFPIEGECDQNSSCTPRLLFAIRPFGTTSKEVEKGFRVWREHDLFCENGHLIVRYSLCDPTS